MGKSKYDKMDYTEFVEHLEKNGIEKREEEHYTEDQFVIVFPLNSRLKERHFSLDGGYQLF